MAKSFHCASDLFLRTLCLRVLIVVSIPGSANATCAATDLPKISFANYEKIAAKRTHNDLLSGLITEVKPIAPTNGPGWPNDSAYLWNETHNAIEAVLKPYYEAQYEPRDVICVAFSEDEFKSADAILAYGGQHILVSRQAHESSPTARQNGIFGADLEAIRSAHKAAIDFLRRTVNGMSCLPAPGAGAWPIRCKKNRELLLAWLQQLQGIAASFEQETESYNEYPVASSSSSVDLESIRASYDRIAALSLVDSVIATAKPIAVKRDNNPLVIPALIYDPAAIGIADDTSFFGVRSNHSLLDFVDDRVVAALPTYYAHLFDQLAADGYWRPKVAKVSNMQPVPTLVAASDGTVISVAVAELICDEKASGAPKYPDLISVSKRSYFQNHIAFFCGFQQLDSMQLLDASEILKTGNSLPTSLDLAAIQQAGNDITTALTNLSKITLHEAALLNDIKKLVGTQQYKQRIAELKAEIAKAEAEANKSGVLSVLQTVATSAGAIAELSNLSTGALTLASKLENMPGDSSAVLYLAEQQDDINKAGGQLGEGAKALGTLQSVIDSFGAQSNAAQQLSTLKAELEQVQKEYAAFQAEIATTVAQENGTYVKLLERLNDLSKEKQGIFLGTQESISKAAVKELIGARLMQATEEARRKCPISVAGFFEAPNELSFESLYNSCSAYTEPVHKLMECLGKSKPTKDSDFLWGNSAGVILFKGDGDLACLQGKRYTQHTKALASTQ